MSEILVYFKIWSLKKTDLDIVRQTSILSRTYSEIPKRCDYFFSIILIHSKDTYKHKWAYAAQLRIPTQTLSLFVVLPLNRGSNTNLNLKCRY